MRLNPIFSLSVIASASALILNETALVPPRLSLYSHLTANFGLQPEDPDYERSGVLVAVEPEDGCSEFSNHEKLDGNIVLVKRGSCQFFSKAWNAERAGAVGVVIGNNVPDDMTLIQMEKTSSENRDVNIPCIFVTEYTYNAALNAISDDNEDSVVAIISIDGEDSMPFFPNLMRIVTYLLIVFPAVWAALTIMHFCRRDFMNRRVRSERRNRNRMIPEVLYSKDLLKGESTSNLDTDESKQGCLAEPRKKVQLTNSSCPICLTNFEEKTKIKLLPCQHGFHSKCITPWIAEHSDSCPICRQTIMDKLPEPQPRHCRCCPCFERCAPDYSVRLLNNDEAEAAEAGPPLNTPPPPPSPQPEDPVEPSPLDAAPHRVEVRSDPLDEPPQDEEVKSPEPQEDPEPLPEPSPSPTQRDSQNSASPLVPADSDGPDDNIESGHSNGNGGEYVPLRSVD